MNNIKSHPLRVLSILGGLCLLAKYNFSEQESFSYWCGKIGDFISGSTTLIASYYFSKDKS